MTIKPLKYKKADKIELPDFIIKRRQVTNLALVTKPSRALFIELSETEKWCCDRATD